MGVQLFTNWAGTSSVTLAASITSSATSLSLTSGEGALFPSIAGGSGNWFLVTIITASESASSASEIVKVTATSTDTFTIVRGQEGTTAQAWAAGSNVALLDTAGTLANFVQPAVLQAQTTNYALDTGSANAYVVALTPALTARVAGMPIRFLAGHSNTGTSTFNDGNGVESLQLANGGVIPPGTIIAGGIYTATWNSTLGAFQLSGYSGTIADIGSLTYTGWSSNPSLDICYSVKDGTVTILIDQSTEGTSNGTAFVISGFPSVIRPAAANIMVPVAGLLDNGAAVPGGAVIIESAGQMNFYKDATQPAWTSSGAKGFSVQFVSFTYPIFLL